MGDLLLNKDLRKSSYDSEVRILAQALTHTVLPTLDPQLKRSVVEFLYRSALLDSSEAIIPLFDADLAHIEWDEAYLRGVNLRGTNLQGTNLRSVDLSEANLREVDLREAKLDEAIPKGADLFRADLRGASLSGATLREAKLSGAKLSETNLSHADLRGLDLANIFLVNANLRYARLSPDNTGLSVDEADPTKSMNQGEWERSLAGYRIAADIENISQGKVYMLTDLSFAKLKGADLEEADLRFVRLHETDLRDVNLAQSDLRGATDSARVIERDSYSPRNPESLVPNDWLERQARSIEGATMPDGSKHN